VGAAWAWGRSTFTDTVETGSATMNMISRTSITSTNGVTLMSAFWRMVQALEWLEIDAAICASYDE
jgi:hypothetical protein